MQANFYKSPLDMGGLLRLSGFIQIYPDTADILYPAPQKVIACI